MPPILLKEVLHAPRDWLRKVRRAGRKLLFHSSISRDGILKLRFPIFVEAIVKATPGSRVKAFQLLYPSLSAPCSVSSAVTCEINSLADFQSSYRHLAAILGHAGKTPPPSEMEFLQRINNRPIQYPGRIGTNECLFLTAFVSILAPSRVVEIGTLGGFSAGIIAATLRRQHGEEGVSRVDTIDTSAKCLIDETRPTGFEIIDSFPELASTIRLHIPHDSSIVIELAERDELEIVFIDANHWHPMPLLDLLRLAPCMKPGGWILLHDTQLGTLRRQGSKEGQTSCWDPANGAEWLFDYWPFRKISGGNIGAIQLPSDKRALIPFALRLMSIPSELEDRHARSAHRALHRSFERLI
jgi:predicted O-methyltransferase YrrM